MPTAPPLADHPRPAVYHAPVHKEPERCACGREHRFTPHGTAAAVTVTHCTAGLADRHVSGRTALDLVERLDVDSGKYLASLGDCPSCGAPAGLRPAAEPLDHDGEEVIRRCTCPACSATWSEVLICVGFRDLESGDNQ